MNGSAVPVCPFKSARECPLRPYSSLRLSRSIQELEALVLEMDAVFVTGIKALPFSLLVSERTVDWRQQNETRQNLGQ